MRYIVQKGREIYETFNFDNPGDEIKLLSVLEKFSEYCNPRKNITMLRQKFFTYCQYEWQTFDNLVTELKKNLVQNVNLKLSMTL